jgi:hypothetical protein
MDVWHGSQTKCDLRFFKEHPYLRLWKTEDKPSQQRPESNKAFGFRIHSRQKIRAHNSGGVGNSNPFSQTILGLPPPSAPILAAESVGRRSLTLR